MKKKRDSFIDVDQVYDPYQKIIKLAFPSINSQNKNAKENGYAKTANFGEFSNPITHSEFKMKSL